MHPDMAPDTVKRFVTDLLDLMRSDLKQPIEWIGFNVSKTSDEIRITVAWPNLRVGKQTFAGTLGVSARMMEQPDRQSAGNPPTDELTAQVEAMMAQFRPRISPEESQRQIRDYEQRVSFVAREFERQYREFMGK